MLARWRSLSLNQQVIILITPVLVLALVFTSLWLLLQLRQRQADLRFRLTQRQVRTYDSSLDLLEKVEQGLLANLSQGPANRLEAPVYNAYLSQLERQADSLADIHPALAARLIAQIETLMLLQTDLTPRDLAFVLSEQRRLRTELSQARDLALVSLSAASPMIITARVEWVIWTFIVVLLVTGLALTFYSVNLRNRVQQLHHKVAVISGISITQQDDALVALDEELNRLQHTLNLQQLSLDSALEGGGIAVWNYDIAAQRTHYQANSDFSGAIGLAPFDNDTTLSMFDTALDQQDRAKLSKALEAAIAGKTFPDTDYRVRLTDGSQRWFLARGQKVSQDLITGVMIDVTESRVMDTALRENEQRYQHLYRNAERQANELSLLNKMRETLAENIPLDSVYKVVVEAIAETFGYTLVSLYERTAETLIMQHQVGYESFITHLPLSKGVMGEVATTGEALFVDPQHPAEDFITAFDDIISEVCVPFFDQNHVVGVINIEGTKDTHLTPDDLRLMQEVGSYVSVSYERTRLYSQTQADEARLQDFLDNANDLIQSTTVKGDLLYVNKTWLEFLGYQESEVLGRSLFDFLDPSCHEHARDVFQTILTGGIVDNFHAIFSSKSGRIIHALGSANSRFENDLPVATRAILHDVSAKLEADEALQKQRLFALRVMETMGQGLTVSDAEGRFEYVNPAYAKMVGVLASSLIGKHFAEAMTLAVDHQDLSVTQELGLGGEYEAQLHHVEGHTVDILVHAVPRSYGSNYTGSIAVITDLTERRKAEAQLQSYQHSLETTNQNLEQVAIFQRNLIGFIQDTLERGLDETFYQDLLATAVNAIPTAEAGTILMKQADQHYHYVASQGFDLAKLQAVVYEIDELTIGSDGVKQMTHETLEGWISRLGDDRAKVILEASPKGLSSVSLPVNFDDDLVGVLNLNTFTPGKTFSQNEIEQAKAFAIQVGVLLGRLNAEESLRQSQQAIEAQNVVLQDQRLELATVANFRKNLVDFMRTTLQEGMNAGFYQSLIDRLVDVVPDAQIGSILVRQANGQFNIVAGSRYPVDKVASVAFSLSELLPLGEVKVHRIEFHEPASLDPERDGILDAFGRLSDLKVSLLAPIQQDQEVIAAIQLSNYQSLNAFPQSATEMIESYAAQAAALLQRFVLEEELLSTQHAIEAQNEVLQEQSLELAQVAQFRKKLVEFIEATLQEGLSIDFYQRLIDEAVAVIPDAQAGSILMKEADGNYHFVAANHYNLQQLQLVTLAESEILKGDGQVSRIFFEANQHLISERRELLDKVGRADQIQVSLMAPVELVGEAVAYMYLDNFDSPDAFDEASVGMMEAFAAQVATLLARLRLEQELRSRQEQIEQSNEELERANRLKSEFLANMSHELRTPLTAIIGFSELLKEEMFGPLNDKQSQYATDIYTSGTHLLSLINDVLDLSKVEAGKLELSLVPTSIPDIVMNALSIVAEKALKANITIHQQISVTEKLTADPRKLKQILFNLLSNAVKFTHEGGRIDISIYEQEHDVIFAVKDTGIGISEDNQLRLFVAFSQVDSSLSKRHDGTGLGLALSKKLVELHGGQLWLESREGQGSTFTFSLPRISKPHAVTEVSW